MSNPLSWLKNILSGRAASAHLAQDPPGVGAAAGARRGLKFEGVPTEAAQYLREAENEYRRIVAIGHAVDAPLHAEITRVLQEIEAGVEAAKPPATQVMWRSLSELEQLVLWATPDTELPLKLAHIRKRYERVLDGDGEPPHLIADSTPSALRCAGVQMLREIHRHHSAVHSRELALTSLLRWMCGIVGVTIALTVAFCCVSLADWSGNGLMVAVVHPLLPVLFCCGMVGAFMSIQRRVQDQRERLLRVSDAVQVLIGLRTGQATIVIGLFTGGVFALVLYLLLLSGLMGDGGGLLPKFMTPDDGQPLGTFTRFLYSASPNEPSDYAKLMVWSVVAGFGERFVPDVLDRLQKQAAGPSKPAA